MRVTAQKLEFCDILAPDEKKPERETPEAYKRLYLLMTVGVQLVVSVMLGLGMGFFTDRYFGTSPWFMLFFIFCGVAAGFLNVYRMAIKEDND